MHLNKTIVILFYVTELDSIEDKLLSLQKSIKVTNLKHLGQSLADIENYLYKGKRAHRTQTCSEKIQKHLVT